MKHAEDILDEKVEKRVQVAKIYGETGNTWIFSGDRISWWTSGCPVFVSFHPRLSVNTDLLSDLFILLLR